MFPQQRSESFLFFFSVSSPAVYSDMLRLSHLSLSLLYFLITAIPCVFSFIRLWWNMLNTRNCSLPMWAELVCMLWLLNMCGTIVRLCTYSLLIDSIYNFLTTVNAKSRQISEIRAPPENHRWCSPSQMAHNATGLSHSHYGSTSHVRLLDRVAAGFTWRRRNHL